MRGGANFSSRELALEILGDLQADVEADEIGESQRSHRVAVAELHRGVDVGRRRDTRFDHAHRLESEHDAEAGRGEARRVPHEDGRLAHPLRGRARRQHDGLVARRVRDDLDELHDVHRIEEVHADDPRRTAGGFRDSRDRQRRRVGRQDRVVRQERFKALKQRLLDGQVFDNRLDDEIRVLRRGLEIGDGRDARDRRRRLPPASSCRG